MHREKSLDFSLCRTFNLDEYVGLPASDPHSYRYYMNEHLFSQVNIDLRNTHLPERHGARTWTPNAAITRRKSALRRH